MTSELARKLLVDRVHSDCFTTDGDPAEVAPLKVHFPWAPQLFFALHAHWRKGLDSRCRCMVTPRWELPRPQGLLAAQEGLGFKTGWTEPAVHVFTDGFGDGILLHPSGHIALLEEGELPRLARGTLADLLTALDRCFARGVYVVEDGELLLADQTMESVLLRDVFNAIESTDGQQG
jgi:hypothetical protein